MLPVFKIGLVPVVLIGLPLERVQVVCLVCIKGAEPADHPKYPVEDIEQYQQQFLLLLSMDELVTLDTFRQSLLVEDERPDTHRVGLAEGNKLVLNLDHVTYRFPEYTQDLGRMQGHAGYLSFSLQEWQKAEKNFVWEKKRKG